MSYRPYPNPTRARHQIERHDDETPPLADESGQPGMLFGRPVIDEEAREALGARLAEIGASLRHGFMLPGDLRQAVPVGVSLQPLADMLRKRPVSSEETTT
jgi:hypothetical protein